MYYTSKVNVVGTGFIHIAWGMAGDVGLGFDYGSCAVYSMRGSGVAEGVE